MNLLGIDFEDWYHPELIQRHHKLKHKNPTIINGMDTILNWLRQNNTYATFFMVGELLTVKPEMLDKILGDGHEIAFHTMHHTRLDVKGFKEKFKEELREFSVLSNGKSKGFRAPTFSLNNNTSWAIDALLEYNYEYDSSVVPAKSNMYGIPSADTKPYRISSKSLDKNDPDGKIIEYPLMITSLLGKKIPSAGGFYLRFLPIKMIENAIRTYNKQNIPSTFYIHSWELTPEHMPKIPLPPTASFITYFNLKKTLNRMSQILQKFNFTSFEKYRSSFSN